ncbi:uncharacterized protein [Choristoneura fumiferana]|uniref:uncharacterized protein n=1 Tax=Choristoneura fumiferana TaxID=7141 RepID=UPI003D1566BC
MTTMNPAITYFDDFDIEIEDLRKKGFEHGRLHRKYKEQSEVCSKNGLRHQAIQQSKQAKGHRDQSHTFHIIAVALLMERHAARLKNDRFIDFHFLRVTEALISLDLFIDRFVRELRDQPLPRTVVSYSLGVITGRGLHSRDEKPKLKPAVITRLQERSVGFREQNPGCLLITVYSTTKMTFELEDKSRRDPQIALDIIQVPVGA